MELSLDVFIQSVDANSSSSNNNIYFYILLVLKHQFKKNHTQDKVSGLIKKS